MENNSMKDAPEFVKDMMESGELVYFDGYRARNVYGDEWWFNHFTGEWEQCSWGL
jgi:hypothetical protein